VLVNRKDNALAVWNAKNGQLLRQWELPGEFKTVAVSPDGRHIVTGNENGTVYVFRLAEPSK
jgi:WD40 repeat protein